ncbi:MAG: fatty acid--CoA ligase family protein [Congregibacter sp.]
MTDFLFERLAAGGDSQGVVHGDEITTHRELYSLTEQFREALAGKIPRGAVVSFNGDYSSDAIALFLALFRLGSIIVPLSSDSRAHFDEYRNIAEVELEVRIQDGVPSVTPSGRRAKASLYKKLRESETAGLVLFSSGSTGKSKGIVQNLDRLLAKFEKPAKAQRMLIFLQLDHIGGINSLLYSLANAGTLITPLSRSPDTVAEAIEKHKVELLPTSPTFLNLLILSGAIDRHDLSSLKLVTYGTEPMQASTLERLRSILPLVRLQQTYGLSEVGILRSRSKSSDSLWMQVGGDEFETKIKNRTLWIKSHSAMLGYLNAPDPFDEDGFLDTGDIVEVDGEWLRILGRDSEIINVGGQKVYPAEVESILLELDGVDDVVVFGEANPITGTVVAAKFKTSGRESARELKARMLAHCRDQLPRYKIPVKVITTTEATYNERFKRMRRQEV